MTGGLVDRLNQITARYAAKPTTSEVSFAIEHPSSGFDWHFAGPSRPYFIASTTKLYTTAVIMQLRHAGAFTLETRAAELLGDDLVRGVNVIDGKDYGPEITVRQLLAHTSGIPDYFEQKRPDGTTLIGEMLRTDLSWSFEDTIEAARSLPGRFVPSTPGKASYSDTNYQLLGRIIGEVTGSSFDEAVHQRIVEPLDLKDTYVFTEHTQERFDQVATMLHGKTPMHIPKAMGSFAADGGIVSTASSGLRFLQAFVTGELFPYEYVDEMTAHWNRIFRPLEYGVGIMRFALPRYYSPLAPAPELIGHSGASGAVLFHVPKLGLNISGTINQVQKRSLSYRLTMQLVAQCQRSLEGSLTLGEEP